MDKRGEMDRQVVTDGQEGTRRGEPARGAGERIRILLVDDQPLLRMGFRLILEAEEDLEVLGEASDGAAAVALAAELDPDVVLMDIRMPGMDGIEATARICRSNGPRVILLTTFDLDEYVLSGLRAGASAFLLKDAAPAELVTALRVVAAGDAVVAPSITRRLLENHWLTGPVAAPPPDPRLAELTAREREVLSAVAEGLSNAEIAARLFVGETTVKTHVGRVLAKLELRDRVQAVVYAYESGLVVPGTT